MKPPGRWIEKRRLLIALSMGVGMTQKEAKAEVDKIMKEDD